QTASGRPFDLAAQNERQADIYDIAAALAKQCRFAGHTVQFYSVAQHSVIVSQALKKHGAMAELLGLLHDAHEAYTGDIISPVANVIASVIPYDAIADLKRVVQGTIHRALRLPESPPQNILDLIAEADKAALATELRDVMAEPQRGWGLKV